MFRGLPDRADVLVAGYRPASLDRFGLSTPELATTQPGLVLGRIIAWGACGLTHDRPEWVHA
ncbi:CoA transferase [Paeniglutamicibacter cryotolerans]|uniref:Crotonobetainyl-CoA:carnitine CoA-transferase CaiB-like acyl-CoA transferase n=1 Tax=Paeniglutamicibacter cryotolerans TaxID=670079 RepID=A0A839QR93_9MICC|nr:crotonobetainyl-CoA:carnitine CoA-transferase CaiB-like acyl-CoA transferase [Paeniglutamicibacter cryotolerans]